MSSTDRDMRRREFLASGSAGLVAAAFARTEAFAGSGNMKRDPMAT